MKPERKSYPQNANNVNQNIQDQSSTKGSVKPERKLQITGKDDCSSGVCHVLWKPEAAV
ncbi:MAG: hypothetical protein K2W82_15840 [Candidatus Obscuribacterales bacterium]|nr:hypothetical protein [Candidatus Obscuribacterales bacterium]